jgi:hypothetical protein
MLLDPIPSRREIRIAPAIGRQLYLNLSQFENVDERTKDSNFGPAVLFVAAVDGGQPVEWDCAGYFWIASRFFLPGPLDCANVGAKVVLRDRTQVRDNLFLCQTARLDGQCFVQCHCVGFLIFSSFLAATA